MLWSSVASIVSLCCILNAAVSLRVVNRPSDDEGVRFDDEKVRFDDYRLYRIKPTTQEHREILSRMENEDGYSFWSNVRNVGGGADVMVAPEKLAKFQILVDQHQMDVEELMDNVQRLIDEENPLANTRDAFGWSAYHNLDSIYRWLDSLASEYPSLITPLVGGETYEGRNIRGVKLSYREGNPGVFIEGGIHAREWISPAVVTYLLNELITSTDAKVRSVAESYDWYVFPVYNPDGYVYTHKTNRLWRKTRRPYGLWCVGADPNRNWDFHWKENGASSNPCSDTFAGVSAFSETETKTMSNFIASVKDKIFSYIAFHSFSQLILLPYGYSSAHIQNYTDLMEIGNASKTALAKRYGTSYKVGNVVELLYPASGGSMDWVRGTLNIPISLTYELRDTGRYGFILPSSQIVPTGEETLDSLVALLEEAKRLGYGVRTT